jgi:pimeloyl-ACP methyl ester carboxylesterase
MPLLAQSAAPPGRLIDLGGRKMHINCTGSGTPTVILEAGASSFSIDWSLVQPEIAQTNRVCSYDRARMGWSDPGTAAETSANIVLDLKRLLSAAEEKGPYVLVGASMGGIYVRVFQMRYPEQVVGMILVDPTHELRLFTIYEGKSVPIASLTAEQYRSVMPKGDVKIPRRPAQTGEPFSRLPKALYETRIELDKRMIESYPASVGPEIVSRQAEAERATLSELNEARKQTPHALGSLPLVILTRGLNTDKERSAAYDELAKLSTQSRHTVVANAGHEIHLYQPAVVVEAIREVISLSRAPSRRCCTKDNIPANCSLPMALRADDCGRILCVHNEDRGRPMTIQITRPEIETRGASILISAGTPRPDGQSSCERLSARYQRPVRIQLGPS